MYNKKNTISLQYKNLFEFISRTVKYYIDLEAHYGVTLVRAREKEVV